MSCEHMTQRIQPGVTYQGVASVFECPWCRIATLEAALRKVELVFGGEWHGDGAEGETLNAVRAALSGARTCAAPHEPGAVCPQCGFVDNSRMNSATADEGENP